MTDLSTLIIRAERREDYGEISRVHFRAFEDNYGVALIVPLQRQRASFDPELSLVAEVEGRIVGHVLFSEYQMRLLGQTVTAVNLSPLGVVPEYQKMGIGARLVEEGHRVVARKGYKVSTVLGHPWYYPRFGYQTHMFGVAELVVKGKAVRGEVLETRVPSSGDVARLHELWYREEGGVDIALEVDQDILSWLSPNTEIKTQVYIRNGEIVGYTRIHKDKPSKPGVFLAWDHEAARSIIATLEHEQGKDGEEREYKLPLHPDSGSAGAFGEVVATSTAWDAGMIYELEPCGVEEYVAQVRAGKRAVGRPTWPVAFDLAE